MEGALPLVKLIEEFAKLPGVGRKTAQRFAFHILNLPEEKARDFSQAILDARTKIKKCPVCGNRDQSKMNVARRTCGYIGTQFWNQGRTQEIRERVLHL